MAYKALYRKYRPSTFDELVGQQHVVMTLQNAIKNNKLAHAYLFCGPRGTGKTSVAKLLAKTINCTAEGERPCGCCHSCIETQEGSNPDVVELDAATNNGVDEVRDLIEKVKYAPINGKYKVYIIDEVHMMTQSAFNALLKTLEEPPEYCVFILATTEPHKVLPTIISRCQRFDFKRISSNVITNRLRDVIYKEQIKCSNDALELIAEIAEGGMRDALSILDQCIAYSPDSISAEDVGAVYGITTIGDKMQLLKYVKEQNTAALVEMISDIANKGIDLQRLTIELIDLCKEAVVYSYSKDETLLKHLSVKQVNDLNHDFDSSQLLTYIDYLMDTQRRYRETTTAQTYFEVCMLKMLDYKPQQFVQTEPVKAATPVKQPVAATVSEPVEKPKKPKAKERIVKEYSDERFMDILFSANKTIKEAITPKWNSLLENETTGYATLLKNTTIMAASPENLIVVVQDRPTANNINEITTNQQLQQIIESYFGQKTDLIAITVDQQKYLIDYFRNHAASYKKQVNQKPVTKEEENPTLEKMNSLFGKDGYDVIE